MSAINEVYQLELSGVEEHKVSKKIFAAHVEQAGLRIEQDVIVWQPKRLRDSNAGSHVILLKHKK
jgi:hypothetical protein